MGKKVAPLPCSQLSWLDMPDQQEGIKTEAEEEDLTTDLSLCTEIPEYFVCGDHGWSNGDVSPEGLEALAHGMLGESEIVHTGDGRVLRYFIVTTAVIGEYAWYACRFDQVLYRSWSGWQRLAGRSGEDDDEC